MIRKKLIYLEGKGWACLQRPFEQSHSVVQLRKDPCWEAALLKPIVPQPGADNCRTAAFCAGSGADPGGLGVLAVQR